MKYRLTPAQARDFVALLSNWLVPDAYPEYEIHSVYFDDHNWDLFRKSIDKPNYKEKLRLRSYGPVRNPKDPVFLEIKKKFAGIVYKRRIDLTYEQAQQFIQHPKGLNVTGKEISWMLEHQHLEPKLFVSYHRKAWTWVDDPDLRITLDSNIQFSRQDLNLESDRKREELFDEETYILEIKSTRNFPIVLIRTLKELGILPASISKAGFAYKKCLERKEIYGLA